MTIRTRDVTASTRGLRKWAAALAAAIWGTWVAAQMPPGSPTSADMPIDARVKSEVIASLAQAIRDTYVYPDVANKLAKTLKDRQAKGAYAAITSANDFSAVLTKQMAEIAHDPHLRVMYSANVIPPEEAPKPGQSPLSPDAQSPALQRQLQRNNYALQRVELLPGNVGYLKLNGFTDADRGGATVAGAMAFLANTDALIIDLRENRGGNPGMVQLLASYFFSGDEPVHLNDLSWRQIGSRAEILTQWWTLPYVPGKRYLNKEVYVLTSGRTFSAAEEFTYDLQALKRATIVGETTRGGANPGGFRRLSAHCSAFIPTGRAINPVTGTNWEGKGVEPDVKAPKEGALQSAQQLALQHLIKEASDKEEAVSLRQALASLEAGSADTTR
jgi:retinol-binding protein 3